MLGVWERLRWKAICVPSAGYIPRTAVAALCECTHLSGLGSLGDGELAHGEVAELALCVELQRQTGQTERLSARPVLVTLALPGLDQIGDHHDTDHTLLPHHPPEVARRLALRALARDVSPLTVVALRSKFPI